MNSDAGVATLDPILRFWWVRLPRTIGRFSAILVSALQDGHYLTAFPPLARFASPLALLLGFVIGWLHPGYRMVPSESLLVLLLMATVGMFSAHVGLLLLAGFALGDFFLGPEVATYISGFFPQLMRVQLPRIIEYALLGLLLVHIPLMTKALFAQLAVATRLHRRLRLGFVIIGHAVLSFTLVFLWTQTVPILIRPVFTWPGGVPTTEAMLPLQQTGFLVGIVAALASAVRLVVQERIATQDVLNRPIAAVEANWQMATPVTPITQRLPIGFVIVGRALWSTLLLAGMFQSWLTALLLGALILVLQVARSGVLPLPLQWWPRLMARLPMVLRLVVGGLIMLFLARLFIGQAQMSSMSFGPIVLLTAVGLIVFFLLTAPVASAEAPGGE